VIANAKFLLYYFENMSGLRINYRKSEVIIVGAPEGKSVSIANMLNCKVGSLPIKYLEIPVSNSKLYAGDMLYVGLKVEKRIPAWQGLGLSSGGKLILIKSSLSSLPNYTMGVYLLLKEVHHKMDSTRANFF
jgi:hypothetical protein